MFWSSPEGMPEWMTWAGCRDTDPDVFYPIEGGSADPAKRICARCPVEGECLEWALARREDLGVWGGKSEGERRKLLRHFRVRVAP